MDLPRFNGDDVIGWLAMAERYLRVHRVPSYERVPTLASHFVPDAYVWMNAFEQRHPNSTWELFVTALLEHFGAGSNTDFKASLSHLQHTTTVDEYISVFTKLSCRAPDWSDEQLLPIFCGGLKSDIRHDVLALEPTSLASAQRLARRYEAKLSDIRAARTNRPSTWQFSPKPVNGPILPSTTSQAHPFPHSPAHQTTITNNPRPQPTGPFRQLSPFEQRERRAKGLCFHCDEQYSKTHICKKPVMAILECPTALDDLSEDTDAPPALDEIPPEASTTYPLHAITTTKIGEMMRFTGTINDLAISIFVDCGSAMNFLHPSIAHKLKLPISPVSSLCFTAASGQPLSPSGLVPAATIRIQDYEFTSPFLLLPVPGCDLLLGAQWLDTLGFFGWHFMEKIMVLTSNGRCHILQGITKNPKPLDRNAILALLPFDHVEPSAQFLPSPSVTSSIDMDPAIQALLSQYQSLFTTPTALPPTRTIDHCIPLLPNTNPINVRPYRYAHSQKEELDKQVEEMLAAGLIRPSRSPYSSPVLLVRKKEGTWRFYVDYRQLNAATIKDRFPIPIVDELLDELHGSTLFSKLDLRFGYHQIRMNEADIPKTAFRTHEGHYEFVVMPFGLSNAPSTFQALMNQVFKPFLRKFVLVFFDDILIYSRDLASHTSHLAQVFQILRANKLHIKLSKFSFGQPNVHYLGHIIREGSMSAGLAQTHHN